MLEKTDGITLMPFWNLTDRMNTIVWITALYEATSITSII